MFEQVDVIVAPSAGEQLVGDESHWASGGDCAERVARGRCAEAAGYGYGLRRPSAGRERRLITFLAGHYQDAKACALARAYQVATGFELMHPKLG